MSNSISFSLNFLKTLLCCLFFVSKVYSQTPQLLKDCNPQNGSSNQYGHTAVNNTLFFVADDGINGEELWKTDGTEKGTMMVKNIGFEHFRSFPKELTHLNGMLYFTANDEKHGNEFWKSDGTELGTVLVKDINKGKSSSQPSLLTAYNQQLYFVVNENGLYSTIWQSSGLESGTISVAKIQQGSDKIKISSLVPAGRFMFLIGEINGKLALWSLEKGNNQLTFIKVFETKAYENKEVFSINNESLVFAACNEKNNDELWISDGTKEGTKLLKEILIGVKPSSPKHFFKHQDNVYFSVNNTKNEAELWQTDGSLNGTKLVKKIANFSNSKIDIQYASLGKSLAMSVVVDIQNQHTIYVLVNNVLKTITTLNLNDFQSRIRVIKGELYIKKQLNNQEEIVCKLDINTSQQKEVVVKNSLGSFCFVLHFFEWNGRFISVANDGINGIELFELKNNQLGLIKNIQEKGVGSNPSSFRKLGTQFSFFTLPTSQQSDLWISDGSSANTKQVYSFKLEEDETIDGVISMNQQLYFFKRNFNQYEFWQSNGTEKGTKLLKTIIIKDKTVVESTEVKTKKVKRDIQQYYPISIIQNQGKLYFNLFTESAGNELWVYDSKLNEVKLLRDIYKGVESSNPSYFIVFKESVYFAATNYNEGTEFWKTDGTVYGTLMVKDVWHGANSSSPAHFQVFNNQLYFAASSEQNGDELWKSDGTSNGTQLLKDINVGNEDSHPEALVSNGNYLFFVANNGKQGMELWQSDGSAEGTKMTKDLFSGGEGSSPQFLTSFNGSLYFVAEEVNSGNELWVSNGTEKGTKLAKDIKKGKPHSFIEELCVVNNRLFFKAVSGENNPEVYLLEAKKNQVEEIEGEYSKDNKLPPSHFFEFNGKLFFVVDTLKTGAELWMIP
jgi:ELWxxDGT repeat protein